MSTGFSIGTSVGVISTSGVFTVGIGILDTKSCVGSKSFKKLEGTLFPGLKIFCKVIGN